MRETGPGRVRWNFRRLGLASLLLGQPVGRAGVVEGGGMDVALAVPSTASLARSLCGPRAADSTAVVVGDVRDAYGRRPLAGATVRASWPEWVFAKNEMEREIVARVARSDSTGQFVLSHVCLFYPSDAAHE